MPLDECLFCGEKVSMHLRDRVEHMKTHGYDFTYLLYRMPMVIKK